MKRDKILVELLLREIEDIDLFIKQTKCTALDDFRENTMLKKSVMMSIINISELINHLSEPFKKDMKQIDWLEFRSIRNVAAHKYGTINFTVVWNIIHQDLPELKWKLLKAKRSGF